MKFSRFLTRRRVLSALLATFMLGVVAINAVAYMHARAMTRFAPSTGAKTVAPEALSFAQKLRILLAGVTVPRPAISITPVDVGLACTTHTFQSTDGNTIEAWHVAATSHVSRTLVVMFPSYASSKSSLLEHARSIIEMNCDVLLVDFRGCGGSSGDETTIGYREADDVIAAASYARTTFASGRIVLMGESMGAAAVLRAMSLQPDLADAVIVEAPFDRLLSTVENRFHAMNLPATPFAHLLLFWGGVRQGTSPFSHNPIEYAPSIRCPVLHLHGEQDVRVTTTQARSLFEQFRGPKRLVILKDSGHMSYGDADRIVWRQAVAEFLNSPQNVR